MTKTKGAETSKKTNWQHVKFRALAAILGVSLSLLVGGLFLGSIGGLLYMSCVYETPSELTK